MIPQPFHCNIGIRSSTAALAETGLDVRSLWPSCKKLPRPQASLAEDMTQKYKSGRLEPLNWRSHAVDLVPMKKSERGASDLDRKSAAPEEFDSDSEDERLTLKGSWTPEKREDYFDFFADINDQLAIAKSWLLLECMPIKARVQHEQDPDPRELLAARGDDIPYAGC